MRSDADQQRANPTPNGSDTRRGPSAGWWLIGLAIVLAVAVLVGFGVHNGHAPSASPNPVAPGPVVEDSGEQVPPEVIAGRSAKDVAARLGAALGVTLYHSSSVYTGGGPNRATGADMRVTVYIGGDGVDQINGVQCLLLSPKLKPGPALVNLLATCVNPVFSPADAASVSAWLAGNVDTVAAARPAILTIDGVRVGLTRSTKGFSVLAAAVPASSSTVD